MRLIDADEFMENLIYCNGLGRRGLEAVLKTLKEQPTAYDISKAVAEIEERTVFLKNCTKYGNENAEQQEKSYSTMMMYEIADLVDDLIDIVRKGGVE